MNFGELLTEFYGSGFDDLRGNATEEARAKRWVNNAVAEICDEEPWPFLEETKEGTAPQTFTNLGHVLSVTDVNNRNPLTVADRRELVRIDPTLQSTGTPERWYMEGESTLKVYPANASVTIRTRYMKAVEELTEESKTPPIPAKYHELIVVGASIRAYRNRDNWDAARAARAEWKEGIQRMVKALIKKNYDTEKLVLRTGYSFDYL